MGEPSEREETTNYAKETINAFLDKREYHFALLLSYIYVDIRLRSLLTDWIKPAKKRWKKTSEILSWIGFRGLVIKCDKLGLLSNEERENLDELREKRNKVAHESTLWKGGVQPDEEKKIKRLCKSAIKFLERTTH